jgi:hypothetical protein
MLLPEINDDYSGNNAKQTYAHSVGKLQNY